MVAPLQQYQAKRDFRRTREPSGRAKPGKSPRPGGIFVIQKHAATRLHYDFRLEHDGVLWSWAVTRGPSLDPSEKRLAVHVEDHPIEYASFEGTIPKGQYGGGSVLVWDEGTWAPDGDPAAGMKKGHIEFELKGNKLNGRWHLVRLRPRPGEKRDNWLLIKGDDAFARPGEDILEQAPDSVKSGLSIDEIGKISPATWQSRPKGKAAAQQETRKAKPVARRGSTRIARLPGFIEPCLATLKSSPPSGAEWVHEVKFDGYRMQAHIENGKTRLLTRTGLDWTERFGERIPKALAMLDCGNAIIDGEIVVLADNGVSSFSALQAALSEGRSERLVYYLFDLLFLDGKDLRSEPLVERKAKLQNLLGNTDGNGVLRFSEHFVQPGQTMLRHACRMGLEGVVSKRADAPYSSGRVGDWIKSKCTLRQEFVILGYLPSDKAGRDLRSLVVGYRGGGELKSAGHVGTGFNAANARDLRETLDGIKTGRAPITGPAGQEKGVVWVKPELVAEVEFRSWTADGNIRHASFQGLREDKPADEVVAETTETAQDAGRDKPEKRSRASAAKAKGTSSVTLSSPDKVLWPEAGLTKAGLLEHYEQVWPRMERFVVNRPLALVRAPDGVGSGQRFFQKHASPGMPDSIARMSDPHDKEELLYIKDFNGLAALVQLGVVEIHLWGSTIDALDTPDQIVFDLDPDEGLGVNEVRAATLDVRDRLEQVGLPHLVKTSGGKGFHVIVPLKPKADWATVKTFAHDFAKAMEQSDPGLYTATLSKSARKGRIFIDYLRNARGSTTVAPYSTRAKPTATVSVPITWDGVEAGVGPGHFTVDGKPLAKALKDADPWAAYDKLRRALKG
ncbi:ATP-dependent DNA ligase LigD phosphoesterase module /ATP-dependent DNA ligase LigD polymerase module [Pseudaminobacter salicylatoxidans]|uniref:DNA ligase (ATP) n=1 Tax=Pseudaminobacter salicylatoxidans TaxID=93369 RepID=A0A316CBW8_PSESE|nr:ATP-dependent DNA ligase LigD phosphoesterase module /ATP-dependent DNA ligase LigD polymerase module [Pseudaminobacter salicylatoxidans]